jgi:hypothetical protein
METMMDRFFLAITLLALSFGASAGDAAEKSPKMSSEPSKILGLWKLDTGSMAVPAEARPASVTAEFIDPGTGGWSTTYVITGKDGSVRRMTSHERLDGQAVPVHGDQSDADNVAMLSPAPGVLVMGLAKDRRPSSTRVYTVTADGRAMVESAVVVGDDGKPAIRTFRWVR